MSFVDDAKLAVYGQVRLRLFHTLPRVLAVARCTIIVFKCLSQLIGRRSFRLRLRMSKSKTLPSVVLS